jgi:hypothetical protein
VTDQYFSISIEPDSLGYQVTVYDAKGYWCEDLFRGFNHDEHADSYAKAREYAEGLYNDLKSDSVDVVLYGRDEL